MKALTIFQPWTSLIFMGAKKFEFRRWDYTTRYKSIEGDRIAIHASARAIKKDEVFDIVRRCNEGCTSLDPKIAGPLAARLLAAHKCGEGILPRSVVLGSALLGRPRRVNELFPLDPDSDRLNQHLFAWPLTSLRVYLEPIPCRGAQGFWNFRPGLAEPDYREVAS